MAVERDAERLTFRASQTFEQPASSIPIAAPDERAMSKKSVGKSARPQTTGLWRVAPSGFRYTVKRGRIQLRGPDGKPRTVRTRGAAARLARELNRKKAR